MAEVPHAELIEVRPADLGGYRQELKRTLGSFQVFATSFAFISVAVGVFGTYDQVLRTAGPVGIWLWVIAAVGQTLVALVIAQFAARIALTGSSYQWASRLANPRIGWWFGLLGLFYLGIRRGGLRQRAGEPGIHAARRPGVGRVDGTLDHAHRAPRPGRAHHRLDAHRWHN
jgi:Amino acid permease